ncbi:unnamed protein product [Acanthoscelides obtectus]|uniref:Uncharacterized protein n=1 Tax=Acanthoscelides obtectus TaxID=200917 RepID=A0A9P0JZI8_ACAOB|nr:unnamed protein product [Acanthoscelides obtectus]CAK1628054.1 hypothetical protein AOBTE_LOCUS4987 [Acanthoscelides obtectus]
MLSCFLVDSFNESDRLRLLSLVKIEYDRLMFWRKITEDPWEPILLNVLWSSFPERSPSKLRAQWKRLIRFESSYLNTLHTLNG